MNDLMGFTSVGSAASEAAPVEATTTEETVIPEGTENTTTDEGSTGEGASSEAVSTETAETTPDVSTSTEPVKETVYVDPFAELGDTERSIFDSIKNKDYSTLKGILDAITTDYDQMTDIDLVRQKLKADKPRWSDEMIDAHMAEKYGIGLEDDEISQFDKLKYQRELLDDGDAARTYFNGKKGEIKFPEISKGETAQTQTSNEPTPEQQAEFAKYWKSHVENSVNGLIGEVIKIEVGKDGSKETFDFPITITDTDKQALKTIVDAYDINNDFQTRYVKDNEVDLKKLMSDRFWLDNKDKLLKAAFAQGHAKGKLGQIKGDKNLDVSTTSSTSSTHDQVNQRTNAALAFLSNGRNR
jgi:hypothetical protein